MSLSTTLRSHTRIQGINNLDGFDLRRPGRPELYGNVLRDVDGTSAGVDTVALAELGVGATPCRRWPPRRRRRLEHIRFGQLIQPTVLGDKVRKQDEAGVVVVTPGDLVRGDLPPRQRAVAARLLLRALDNVERLEARHGVDRSHKAGGGAPGDKVAGPVGRGVVGRVADALDPGPVHLAQVHGRAVDGHGEELERALVVRHDVLEEEDVAGKVDVGADGIALLLGPDAALQIPQVVQRRRQ